MRTCVIFNPAARGEKARRFREHLAEIGSQCTLKSTRAAGDARSLAREAVLEGYETIVAAGGDGTVNEVTNGIADAPEGFSRSRLAVLPLGTVNVFALELGIPAKLEPAWSIAISGSETEIDLPQAEFSGPDGTLLRRYFAQLAGAGLDARAVELVHWPLKKKIGPLAYVWAGLKALAAPASHIEVEAGDTQARGQLVLLGNGRLYGGRYRLFPGADMRDGLLEICVFPTVNWLTLARCGPQLLLSGTVPSGSVCLHRAGRVTLSSVKRAPLQLDGEHVGALPATLTISPHKLRVMVPKA